MRAVMVANPKGGVGKTTLATNLAGYFANKGKAVSLCDIDRQQSSLRWIAFRAPELASITGYYAGNQMLINLPREPDWVVLDAPAGFQGYKLEDYMRAVDRVIIPIVPSIFDMAATEDFLNTLKKDLGNRSAKIGIVAMRIDPRTRAASMLDEFLRHFHIPLLASLRSTQNYVNAAAAGLTIFDPPHARNRRDVEQWAGLLQWIDKK
ncbi:MAG: ParA family protein [Zoogloeaceae bacterium]|jgi:chromosome partitioning protein|nr:ParA family protein [Zoogloeaceae bacterium]